MAVVPNVPGVPALTSYITNSFTALIADSFDAAAKMLVPSWGLYIEGIPVITPASLLTQQFGAALSAISQVSALIGIPNVVPVTASFISLDYRGEAPVSNYQQERGAFQSYDKVVLPYDLRIKLACSGSDSDRQAFFGTLEALKNSTALVDVVTPEIVYTSMNCTHVDYQRRAERGRTLIVADVMLQEIREIDATTFSNTQSPIDAGTQSIGNVQPQTPSSSTAQQFAGVGGSPY